MTAKIRVGDKVSRPNSHDIYQVAKLIPGRICVNNPEDNQAPQLELVTDDGEIITDNAHGYELAERAADIDDDKLTMNEVVTLRAVLSIAIEDVQGRIARRTDYGSANADAVADYDTQKLGELTALYNKLRSHNASIWHVRPF